MNDKRWVFQTMPEPTEVASLANAIGVDSSIAALLVQKGVTDFDQAKNYFRPSLEDLHDPFLMKDMDKAVQRLGQAIQNQEAILIYGDYDVDGVTSVSLVYGFLKQYCDKLRFYIPDRYKEGYGVSKQAINWAIETGISLIITLDCGIKATECIQQAQIAGIDVIICDHHEPGEALPPAYAILDPKQKACLYPFKELSGCAVGFKLLQAFVLQQNISLDILYQYLGLVAISIACDLVPLTGENRILAYHGLKCLNNSPSFGIQAIIRVANLPWALGISQLVFGLGPRLNAAGRVDHGSLAVNLLLAEDPVTASSLARQIEDKNGFRRYLDSTITAEALQLMKAIDASLIAKTTVLFKEDWHKGVIGIVASRCIEHYYRPTIILTASGNKATGSARSVAGYNIYEAITSCSELLEQYGGHAHAAGLTLPLENIIPFQERFEQVVSNTISQELLIPVQNIDLLLSLEKITNKFYNILNQMAPFGNGNMRPVFATELVIATKYRILKENHLKLTVQEPASGVCIDAIGFGLAEYAHLVCDRKPFKIAYTIERNNYQGQVNLQLNIKGLQPI
ncbi:MAG: single-stranded-DNA-specific exonuclease RecJ [Candidatus Amoebophilus sp.]